VEVAPFLIEEWYERYEFSAELMLSSSDCESRTVADLLALEPGAAEELLSLRLGYTEVPGAPALREAIASSYHGVDPDDVLVVAAAEEAIFLAWHALVRPGDAVVVETPCYGSALELARSAGADVRTWQRRSEERWAHDLEALEGLLAGARALYVNTPHNPTGLGMARTTFDRVTALCAEHDVVLVCDEVYRGLEHGGAERLPAACEVLPRALSLGTVSKAYGLPGLRLGWIVVRDARLRAALRSLKLYTTICSSAPSEVLVALAVRRRETLVREARELVASNLPLVDALLDGHADVLSWTRPDAGPIGFARWHGVASTRELCERVVAESGVLLLPGDVYGVPDHVRLGFGRRSTPAAIERVSDWLRRAR
jgi:aspartate/methionine/tyrosine aminotransferase